MAHSSGVSLHGCAIPGQDLEILLSPGTDPIVTLDETGRTSRVILGRSPAGRVAVKIGRNDYRPIPGQISWTNPEIVETWDRELSRLREGMGETGIVTLAQGGGKMPPITICTKIEEAFHPVCPVCKETLGDCRDDALLEGVGMPSYSKSHHRFLCCGSCVKGSEPPVLYTYATEAEVPGNEKVKLRRRHDLYRDGGAPPCTDCDRRKECYSPGTLADTRLISVTYYESPYLPMEVMHLHFDELCDFIGGAEWEAIRARAPEAAGRRGRNLVLEPLGERATGPLPWAHGRDASGLLPVEILWLKMIAFTQLCRGMRAYHKRFREPHLSLDPGSAMVRLPEQAPDFPARWNFQVRVIDLGGPVPSPDTPRAYVAPYARGGEAAHIPADIHSLGMILFRALLVNDIQDLGAVEEATGRVLESWEAGLKRAPGGTDPDQVCRQLRLQVKGEGDVFDRNAVLYNAEDRRGKASALPRGLWSEVMELGFRMMTNRPGFSICVDPEDYSAEEPGSTLDRVVAELERINTRLRVELFAHGARDLEISRVCEDILSEMTQARPMDTVS